MNFNLWQFVFSKVHSFFRQLNFYVTFTSHLILYIICPFIALIFETLREVLEDPVLRHTSPIWANKGSATSNLKLYDVISYETVMKHY